MTELKEKLSDESPQDPLLQTVKEELEFLELTGCQVGDSLPRSKRRVIKSHMPFSLLPPDLLQRNKAR